MRKKVSIRPLWTGIVAASLGGVLVLGGIAPASAASGTLIVSNPFCVPPTSSGSNVPYGFSRWARDLTVSVAGVPQPASGLVEVVAVASTGEETIVAEGTIPGGSANGRSVPVPMTAVGSPLEPGAYGCQIRYAGDENVSAQTVAGYGFSVVAALTSGKFSANDVDAGQPVRIAAQVTPGVAGFVSFSYEANRGSAISVLAFDIEVDPSSGEAVVEFPSLSVGAYKLRGTFNPTDITHYRSSAPFTGSVTVRPTPTPTATASIASAWPTPGVRLLVGVPVGLYGDVDSSFTELSQYAGFIPQIAVRNATTGGWVGSDGRASTTPNWQIGSVVDGSGHWRVWHTPTAPGVFIADVRLIGPNGSVVSATTTSIFEVIS